MTKIKALAKFLEEDEDRIIESKHDKDIFEVDNQVYLVCTNEEADERAREYILDSVWTFRPSFLIGHMPDGVDEEIIEFAQKKCESANDGLVAMLKDKDYFVEDAVCADGRGHFLSQYDGAEYKVEGYYIYRTN